ncbi:MAG: ABC transporter ATP-binding protein [archaeon]|nr:ABC transporter ATP-binding protein [archaeon]
MSEDIIVAKGITVRYGDFTAVDDLSVNVRKGEIYGFLGPNGAGKTTTAKVLATMMTPTAGTIVIGGHDTSRNPREARQLVGVVQQHIAVDKDISVRENIIVRAMLHKVPRRLIEERMAELCEIIGLTPYMDKTVQQLSGGWKRKLAIVCALIHDPEILFLDEPTAGLDTQSRHMLWDMVRVLNRRGTTVFITTHYMDEAESLCDRVSIITHGRLTDTGTPKELCDRLGRFTVEYDGEDGRRQYRFFDSREEAKTFFDTVEEMNGLIRGTHLEDVFLEETGRTNVKALEKALRI